MHPTFRFILWALATIVLAGATSFILLKFQPSPPTVGNAVREPLPAVEPLVITPQATTPSREDIESKNPNGPWARDLKFAIGDGTTFGEAQTFMERAGVPSVIRDVQGRLVAAFQWFPEDDEAWDKVAVSISPDDAETWSEPELIVMEGMPEGYQRPFDPTLALTQDGDIRLYFTSSEGLPGPNGSMEIYSGISQDGVAYEFEEGERFAIDGGRAYDSAALLLGEMWHLLTPYAQQGAYYATGSDGLAFDRQDDVTSTPWNWTGNLVAWEEGMRFYGGGPGNIWWTSSEGDGTWSAPKRTNTSGGDPSVVELQDGRMLMIFVGEPVR